MIKVVQNKRVNVCAGRREPKEIPQPVLTYNKSMGGVDLHDQHRAYYPVGRSCNKWWRYIFWFIVQSSIINAWIIRKKTNRPETKSNKANDPLDFRLAIFNGLVKGNARGNRAQQMQPAVAGAAITNPNEHPSIKMPGRKKNCVQCQRVGRRTPKGHGVETVFGCTLCKVHLCRGHCSAIFHQELLL